MSPGWDTAAIYQLPSDSTYRHIAAVIFPKYSADLIDYFFYTARLRPTADGSSVCDMKFRAIVILYVTVDVKPVSMRLASWTVFRVLPLATGRRK